MASVRKARTQHALAIWSVRTTVQHFGDYSRAECQIGKDERRCWSAYWTCHGFVPLL